MAYRLVFAQSSASYDAVRARIDGLSKTPAAAGNLKWDYISRTTTWKGKGSSLERKSSTGEQSHQSQLAKLMRQASLQLTFSCNQDPVAALERIHCIANLREGSNAIRSSERRGL